MSQFPLHDEVEASIHKPKGGKAPSADVRDTLKRLRSAADVGAATDQVVRWLRTCEYDIADLVDDARHVKRSAAPEDAALVDDLLERCVRRTALVHEKAIESMAHGFCEVDPEG